MLRAWVRAAGGFGAVGAHWRSALLKQEGAEDYRYSVVADPARDLGQTFLIDLQPEGAPSFNVWWRACEGLDIAAIRRLGAAIMAERARLGMAWSVDHWVVDAAAAASVASAGAAASATANIWGPTTASSSAAARSSPPRAPPSP